MSTTVFISRSIAADSPLRKSLAEMGVELIDQAMIETTPIAIEGEIPSCSWAFFSSKNAVTHFFAQASLAKKVKLAAIGEGTARMLRQYGEVAFVGSSSDTTLVAEEFAKVAGRSKVLFPIASQSVRTVQQALSPKNVAEIICYETKEKSVLVGNPDILVFSSPSNIQSFLKQNSITSNQRIVAFGKTTGAAAEETAAEKVIISKGTSDNALTEAIKRAIHS